MRNVKILLQFVVALVLSLTLSLFIACDYTGTTSSDSNDTESTSESVESEENGSLDDSEDNSIQTESDEPTESEESNEVESEEPTESEESNEVESEESGEIESDESSTESEGNSSESEESSEDDPNPTDGAITTAEELVALIEKINTGELPSDTTIELGADIDMEGVDYTPIYEFSGVFDGKGYTIFNLELPLDGATIYLTDGNWVGYSVTAIGLISSAYDARVINLTLSNVTADFDTGEEIFVGAIVGYTEGIEIVDCSVSSTMRVVINHETVEERSISGVAGVIGYSLDAQVDNTSITCEIDYSANSYEAFLGSVLGVGNVRVFNCNINFDLSFVGDMFGHTGYIIGMERTPSEVPYATMMESVVTGLVYIANSRGYDWGEVGQGYLYDQYGDILQVDEYNEIDVVKTYA